MNPNTPGSSTNDATPVSTLGSLSSTRTARSLFGQMLVGSGMSPLGKALGQNHLAIGTKNCRWNGLASVGAWFWLSVTRIDEAIGKPPPQPSPDSTWPMVKRIYIGASDAQRGMRPGQSQMTFFDTGYGQQTQNVPHQRAQEQGPHAQTRWRCGAAAATVETQAPLPPRHLGWHLRFPSEVAQAHEAHLDIGVPAGLNTDAAAVGGQPPAKRWSATASQHSLARLASLCPAVEATAHFTCVGMAPSLDMTWAEPRQLVACPHPPRGVYCSTAWEAGRDPGSTGKRHCERQYSVSLQSVLRTAMWVCGLHPKVHTKSSLHLLYSAFASEPPKQHEYGAREAQVTAQQCASSQRAAAPTPARKSETPPGGPGPKVRTWSLASQPPRTCTLHRARSTSIPDVIWGWPDLIDAEGSLAVGRRARFGICEGTCIGPLCAWLPVEGRTSVALERTACTIIIVKQIGPHAQGV
ncbi:hypothetical protein PCL_09704 [Purpureocillium lilacinum]|uniref:Uncharacterized protein n=1 Tax=Purpureocillium lilacinum TaxID=33203 RepID=A0A2U3EDV1_PURLI|nr:hypothetical protein PCL_09704 [Purpureocillium lilacinum]